MVASRNDVGRYIARLASEHAHKRNEAFAWLLDHLAQSRPRLVELVEGGQFDERVLGAIYILGQMGQEADVPLLAKTLTEGDQRLAWNSAQALGEHPSPLALDALLAALQHDDADVVGAAAVALGMRGNETTREELERLLERAGESVRYQAVYALRQLGVSPSIETLKKQRERELSAEVRALINEVLQEETQ